MTDEKKLLVLSRKSEDAEKELEHFLPPESLQIFESLKEILDTAQSKSQGIYLPEQESQLCLGPTARITTIFNSLPVGIVILDLDYKILWGNKQFYEWCCQYNDNHTEEYRKSIQKSQFYSVVGKMTLLGPDYNPFHTANHSQKPVRTIFRNTQNEYFQMDVVPQPDASEKRKTCL